jgi:UDP-N-acetylmuramate--alanine ligase
MGHRLGVPLAVGAIGIAGYQGVGRRFQPKGEAGGVTFVDEYAHLPGEVKAALAAARGGDWERIVAVFQPHRYSRTDQVGRDFGGAFDDADVLVLNGIYTAGEPPRPGITGHIVREAVEGQPGHPPITYVEERSELAAAVTRILRPGDLCLTIGAGDITALSGEVMERLS